MAMPEAVTITDVALRDGLQNHPHTLPTDEAGSPAIACCRPGSHLEAGSFVHPELVPQMADADEIFRRLPLRLGRLMALVPNLRGAERALAAEVKSVRIVLSCSEGHSRANTNRSVDEGIAETMRWSDGCGRRRQLRLTGALATAFVCPFDGVVPIEQVDRVVGAWSTWA